MVSSDDTPCPHVWAITGSRSFDVVSNKNPEKDKEENVVQINYYKCIRCDKEMLRSTS